MKWWRSAVRVAAHSVIRVREKEKCKWKEYVGMTDRIVNQSDRKLWNYKVEYEDGPQYEDHLRHRKWV